MDDEPRLGQGFGPSPPPLTAEQVVSIEPLVSDRASQLGRMTEADIGKLFDRYDFRDAHGHPLTHAIDFMALMRLARPKQEAPPKIRKLPPGETTAGKCP